MKHALALERNVRADGVHFIGHSLGSIIMSNLLFSVLPLKIKQIVGQVLLYN